MELQDYLNIIREFSTQYGNLLEDLMEQFGYILYLKSRQKWLENIFANTEG